MFSLQFTNYFKLKLVKNKLNNQYKLLNAENFQIKIFQLIKQYLVLALSLFIWFFMSFELLFLKYFLFQMRYEWYSLAFQDSDRIWRHSSPQKPTETKIYRSVLCVGQINRQ